MVRLIRKASAAISGSITGKYLLIFALVLIIPILMIYNWIVGYANRMLEEDIVHKNLLSADALVKRFNAEIGDVVLQLRLISEPHEENGIDTERMFERASRAIAGSSLLRSIYMLDEDKRVVFEAPFEPRMEQNQQPLYYDYAPFDTLRWSYNYVVSDVLADPFGNTAVTVSIPVLDGQEHFHGVLVAKISREYLSEVLMINTASHNGFGMILDRDGFAVASTNASDIDQYFGDSPIARHLAKYTSGHLSSKFNGEPSILVYKTMWDGWGLILGLPERYAFQPVRNLSLMMTLSFAGILMLALVLVSIGVRKILHPIVGLTRAVRRFGDEQPLTPVKNPVPGSRDELSALWNTFLEMARSIQEKQRQLEDQKRYMRDVIESIPYAIITIDNKGKVAHVNREFEQITGYDRHHVIGRMMTDLPSGLKELKDMLAKTAHAGQLKEQEAFLIDAQDRKHILKITASKFYNEAQQEIGTIAVFQDITHFKQLEIHASQSEKLALLGQISAGIAHELKNPLAVLSGAAELLKEDADSGELGATSQEWIDDIHNVVRRMNGIVNNFLSFAKMKNENAEPFSMEQLLKETLHLLRIKLRDAGIKPILRCETGDSQLIGKYNKLMQVFLNLILNSIEAMPSGGTLTIRLYKTEDHDKGASQNSLVVELSDTGVGIPEESLDWVLDPFFSTKKSGSGLGLTIARDIIAEHNGELQIESRLKEGTCIRCRFPLHEGRAAS